MRFYFIIILCTLFACHNFETAVSTDDHQSFNFKLLDSLGEVSIALPKRADTFFNWIQQSDCGRPCEHVDYRFQPKRNRIFKESGFYWRGDPQDSVEQLTISHLRPDKISKHNGSSILLHKESLLAKVISDPDTWNVLSDSIAKFGDRQFYIIKTAGISRKIGVRDRRLIAFTTVAGTILEFHYKLLTTKYDSTLSSFFDESMENLSTVRIKDGG